MATGKQVIATLNSHIGDSGSFVWKWYGNGTGWAWCNATVCWAFSKANASKLFYGGKKVSYCPTSIKWCENNLAQIPLEIADPGDVIYFDWDKNGVPNHIGFVRARNDHNSIHTIEGNAGSPSRVRKLTRPAKYVQAIFRPHYPMTSTPTTLKLAEDGQIGQKTIYSLQKVLKVTANGMLTRTTVKALQKLAKVSADGAWGTKTTKALQKMLGVTADGDFGPKSQKAFQRWINKKNGFTTTTPAKTTTSTTTPAKAPERVKSSYIGHARSNLDGKAGDSSGKEVVKSKFTYSTSSTSVYNWTYVFRPNDIAKANKAAEMCIKAVKNNKIGYCSSGQKTYGDHSADKLAKKVGYDLSKITTKTGLSCGDLICLCNHYAGLSKVYIGSALPLVKSYKANNNFKTYKYSKGMTLYKGDVLVTAHSNGKHNHVVMCV